MMPPMRVVRGPTTRGRLVTRKNIDRGYVGQVRVAYSQHGRSWLFDHLESLPTNTALVIGEAVTVDATKSISGCPVMSWKENPILF